MNRKEAHRKIELLRRITPDRGASTGEAEAASRLARQLKERYGLDLDQEDNRPNVTPHQPLTWTYWGQLVDELGLNLSRFGARATVELQNHTRLIIRLEGGRWYVERRSRQGWQQIASGTGVLAARDYLTKQVPRRYTFLRS